MERRLGYAMFGVGFLMLLANAISYLSGLEAGSPVYTVLGIAFCILGMGAARSK